MDAIEKGRQFRPARIQARTRRGGLDRKAHLDVCRGELIAPKPPMLGELGLQISQMQRNLRLDERAFGSAGDGPRDRPCKERHRRGLDAIEDQLQQQRRHGRALRVMQPIGVAQPLRRTGGRREPAVAIAIDHVFDDGARLRQRQRSIGDDRRFPERMHGTKRWWRQHGLRIALVAPDLVLQAELFEQPQHALRARVIQVVDDDHENAYSQSAMLSRHDLLWLREGPNRYGEHTDRSADDERPPIHHRITSSAPQLRDYGMVRSSAFAVLRLMTRSNLIGCSTGKSPALPLAYAAASSITPLSLRWMLANWA